MNNLAGGQFEEAEEAFRSQIKILEDEVARLKKLMAEAEQRYKKEQELMLSHLHIFGMKLAKQHLGAPDKAGRLGTGGPSSWLGQQRRNVSVLLLNHNLKLNRPYFGSSANHWYVLDRFFCTAH